MSWENTDAINNAPWDFDEAAEYFRGLPIDALRSCWVPVILDAAWRRDLDFGALRRALQVVGERIGRTHFKEVIVSELARARPRGLTVERPDAPSVPDRPLSEDGTAPGAEASPYRPEPARPKRRDAYGMVLRERDRETRFMDLLQKGVSGSAAPLTIAAIASLIRARRMALGVSRDQLAAAALVSLSAVYDLEERYNNGAGSPKLTTLQAVVGALRGRLTIEWDNPPETKP